MRKLALILSILVVSGICQAGYSNHQLYQAYLTRDMSVWEQYIASANWDSMTVEEQKQLLNYEYGYAAYSVSHEGQQAEIILNQYEKHLHASKGKISDAEYYAYLAGLYSYKLSLDKSRLFKYSNEIFDNIKRAMQLEPNNPFVLSMQGNVEFYSPFGSKKKALDYYQRAEQLYLQQHQAKELWNVRAVQMTIVQCLEKMNREEEAKQQCLQYLKEEPNCVIFQLLLAELESNNK